MASSLSPVCFPFVQASYADVATACSARLSLCGRGTGPPQADRQYGHGKESAVDAADMFPADEQASEDPEPREAALRFVALAILLAPSQYRSSTLGAPPARAAFGRNAHANAAAAQGPPERVCIIPAICH